MNKKTYTLLALTMLLSSGAQAQKIKLNNQSRWGFDSDRLGWVEIKERINNGGEFSEGLASVRIGKKWGFIDTLGRLSIPAQFDEVKEFHNGFAAARQGKLWGIIDTDGVEVIPFQYDYTDGFYDGLALVKKDGKFGYINADNTLVIGYNFPFATSFFHGLAAVKEEEKGKFGYIDRAGNFKIPCTYDDAQGFENGVAQVKANGRKYFIDTQGNYYNKKEDALLAAESILRREQAQQVSNAAAGISGGLPAWVEGGVAQGLPPTPNVRTETLREYLLRCGLDNSDLGALVAKKLKEWQKKGNYETSANYEMRVTPEGIENKRKELYAEYQDKYNAYIRPYMQAFRDAKKKDFLSPDHVFELREYDEATQRYRINSNRLGDIWVPVPSHKAQIFRDRWQKILTGLNCVYLPYGDDMRLAELDFAGFKYVFDVPQEPVYGAMMASNDEEPEAKPDGQKPGEQAEVAEEVFVSDVDRNIPEGINPDASRMYAIIIGNEHYTENDCSDVPYAVNDATSFKEYCERALGISPKNIYFRTDATLNQMRGGVRWFKKMSDAYDGDVKLLFYYAGHGVPNESGTDSFLLPADGIPGDYESAYQLSRLYEELGNTPSKNTTVFLDACFSGAKRSGGMLMSARAVAIDVPEVEPLGNMVVFSAASGEETAMPYNEQHHGLFTYFLLKKLQQTGGSATYRELYDYLSRNVRQFSLTENQKAQTPSVEAAYDMEMVWEALTLNSEGVGITSSDVVTYSPEIASKAAPAPAVSISDAAVSAAIEGSAPRRDSSSPAEAGTGDREETSDAPAPTPTPAPEPEPTPAPTPEPTRAPTAGPTAEAATAPVEAPVQEEATATPHHISQAALEAALGGASPKQEQESEPEITLPITPREENESEAEISLPITPME